MNAYEVFAEVQGSAAKPYRISIVRKTGESACSCPAWTRTVPRRDCKHVRAVVALLKSGQFESTTINVFDRAVARRVVPTLDAGGNWRFAGLDFDAAPAPVQAAAPEVDARFKSLDLGPAPARSESARPESARKLAAPTLAPESGAVLLAQTWDGVQDLTGWYVSEKFDGVRAIWDGSKFVSRKGNTFDAPEWFTAGLPKAVLDGELWLGRGRFNECSGIARRAARIGGGGEWRAMRYLVFDAPTHKGTFEVRQAWLRSNLRAEYAQLVQQVAVPDNATLARLLKNVEEGGGEGLMARQPGSLYVAARSSTLLKIKSFTDTEATVEGFEPGEGKHKGRLGALKVRLASGVQCKVGTGFSDRERERPPAIGSTITLRYFELDAKSGVPRFPSYVGRRDYE